MIVVTGAAGFIGSCLLSQLNKLGYTDILCVDDFGRKDKIRNLTGKQSSGLIHRDDFVQWFASNAQKVIFIYHLGARTDTTEMNTHIFDVLNLEYSKSIWNLATRHQIPLIYASSAATYGDGSYGYSDSHELPKKLKPLNPYGVSKNEFDKWVLKRDSAPPFWAGLKFFNVYGPNEYHKGRMASVIFHTFHQIKTTGRMKLFRSHRSDFEHGHQSRDFIYIKDIVNICLFLKDANVPSALYNVGTGKARTFMDLATATFESMDLSPEISFMDTPLDIRDTYQYFTEAKMKKLIDINYNVPFYELEEGVKDYVKNFLLPNKYY